MSVEPARFVLTLSCGDRRGIVAAVANCIASQGCNDKKAMYTTRIVEKIRIMHESLLYLEGRRINIRWQTLRLDEPL